MQISDILTPDRCFYHLAGESKKRLFVLISRLVILGSTDLDAKDIFQRLVDRERLGPTAVGQGVALPHARIPQINTIEGIFVQLDGAVDFDAADEQPVDLVFALFVPSEEVEEHNQVLARLATIFRNKENCEKFRRAQSGQELYELITEFDQAVDKAA